MILLIRHPAAFVLLSWCYYKGIGVSINTSEASRLFDNIDDYIRMSIDDDIYNSIQ